MKQLVFDHGLMNPYFTQSNHLRRSEATIFNTCRLLFHIMSVTQDSELMNLCSKLLEEQISTKSSSSAPYSVKITDLLIVLMNYGSTLGKLWPEDNQLSFPTAFKAMPLNHLKIGIKGSVSFPYQNLLLVLRILQFNLQIYPDYTEKEKTGLFYLMLNLLMDSTIVLHTGLVLLIKSIIVTILQSFTEEEWAELDFKKVC